MSDLTARLEALLRNLRLFAASSDHSKDTEMGEQFRDDLALLIAEYGRDAVSAALDEMPNWQGPLFSLH
jgi:phage tail tape-measure protein